MSKRKRDSELDPNPNNIAVSAHQHRKASTISTQDRRAATRLHTIIESGSHRLLPALKLARGFERQKLGRRVKTAHSTNDGTAVERLNEEIAALKGLELSAVANAYLVKRCGKVTRIGRNEVWKIVATELGEGVERNDGEEGRRKKSYAEMNVLGRLFKASGVRAGMEDTVESIRKVLKIESEEDNNVHGKNGGSVDAIKPPTVPANSSTPVTGDDKGATNGAAGRQSQAQEEDPFFERDQSTSRPRNDSLNHGNVSDDAEESSSDDKNVHEARRSRIIKPTGTNSLSSLPSLAYAGYISGSDDGSVAESLEDLPRRKNRRGQRARQKIAEMKHGQKANHLQHTVDNRDRGWDMKRGATDRQKTWERKGMKDRGRDGESNGRHRVADGGATQTVDTTERPEHPSWEAARHRKQAAQKMRGGLGMAKGQKITFDS